MYFQAWLGYVLPLVGVEHDEVLRINDGHGDESSLDNDSDHHDFGEWFER